MNAAMNERIMWPARVLAWFDQNASELLIGAGFAGALVAAMLILRIVGRGIIRGDPHCRTWRSVIGRVFAKTSILFMVFAALDIVANYTSPPPKIAHPLDIAFTIVAALQAAVWARELIMGIVARGAGDEVGETALDNAQAVIRVLVSVVLFAIAFLIILENLGVNVTALVAGLGIGGIAIGLAAQGIFSDLFAALAILFDKPFKRGDTIRYDDTTGTVERIGLKTTRLRSLNGEQVVMANTKLLEREIHNYAGGESRRCALPFGLVYQTDPKELAKVPSLVKAAVESRKGCSFVRCAILGFAASSIDFETIFDCASSDANKVAADRTAVALAIMRSFASHDMQFAYPVQTTFTAAPDGTLVMPYAAPAKS